MHDVPAATSELIQQARAGDAQAMEVLFQRYREYVRLLVRCQASGGLQSRVDSSDFIQETLLRAAQHFRRFNGASEAEWRAWLARIAEHEIIHQRRHHLGTAKRAVSRAKSWAEVSGGSGAGDSLLGHWFRKSFTSPSLAAMRKERSLLLANTLALLPDDYREVLILRHLEGLDFPDVAQRMKRTSGAVRVLWTCALKKLREALRTSTQLV